MFVYHSTFITLQLKVNKSTESVIGWKSVGLYKSKPLPLNGAFLPSIKYFSPKVAIQFNNKTIVKQKRKVCLSLHCNVDNSYFFVNGKEKYKFKASNKNVNFPTQFYLGIMSNKFNYVDEEEVSLKATVYDFLIDYNAINKSVILDIHKYLLVKNNLK